MRYVPLRVCALFPVFLPRCFTDAGIHAVCRVIRAIKLLKCVRGFIKMSDVVFRRILCAAFTQKGEHLLLQFVCIDPFLDDVILMEDIAHKVAVIELVHQLAVELRRRAISSARISSTSSECTA